MMILFFFKQLSNVTGLPLMVSIFSFVVTFSLALFGILIFIKIRSIKKGLNNLNDRLDIISQGLGLQSGEFENLPPYKFNLGSQLNDDLAADDRTNSETIATPNLADRNGSEERRINTKIRKKIHALLKKSGKPTPYHDLTKHLSIDFPGYNYDFFLKEVEDLQKEGKVEVQLIAGKLYFQIKKT
jgi:hypothetical protein